MSEDPDWQAIKETVAKELAADPAVSFVQFDVEPAENYARVLTVLDDVKTPEIRRRIYAIEGRLLDQFPDVDFDFNIASTKQVSPTERPEDVIYHRRQAQAPIL